MAIGGLISELKVQAKKESCSDKKEQIKGLQLMGD